MPPRPDPTHRASALRPAGFWRRYAAWSIDALILVVPAALLAWLPLQAAWPRLLAAGSALAVTLALTMQDAMRTPDPAGNLLLALAIVRDPVVAGAVVRFQDALLVALAVPMLAWTLVAAPWFVLFESGARGATPGKRALDIRAADAAGARLRPVRAAARFFAGALSWATLNLGHALAAWTPERRALHDIVAGSRVLLREGADPRLPRWVLPWLGMQGCALLAGVAWLLGAWIELLLRFAA
ncbi:RDD family protein [Coralloluteibacterium stylophorae]|uniref:RDD family protein n=1 Tax=Coralloluteibacterium stylophorae TaxID=1776034 RepID=A0A8J7VSE4_9GAMM|nr:RDD family protein [Coralloluteibacterium stylophorae]MBS7457120.1 RDD family protein [Coralloluteibacterium stylophorae]